MAQVKISELGTLAQQLQNSDYVPVIHSGVTYKFAPFNYLVKNSGDETIAGVKTFSSTPIMTLQGGSASSVIDTIQLRKDTAANWTSVNPVLHQGEEGLETDTGKRKTGDGVTAWNSLGYSLTPLSSTPSAGKVTVWETGVINAQISTNYFMGIGGSFTLTQINDMLHVRAAIGFTARTITVSDLAFTFTGLSVSSSRVLRALLNADTNTLRTTAVAEISIATDGSGVVRLFPNGDRAIVGGTIDNAIGLYGDVSVYLG